MQCRSRLLPWCIEALSARYLTPAIHHRLLIDALEKCFTRVYPRLMIFMPPGSAKSTYTSVLSPPHLFARFPGCQIIGASHTADLAEDFSGKIHGIIRENEHTLGYGLRTENRGRWYTTNGGSYLAAGVGGAIPGFRADFGIIDDPIKGRQAADSEADRKRVRDWYLGDFERRLTPGAPVVLMHTRWHESDLAGGLLEDEPDRWHVLSLPAQAEIGDALNRSPGEWLWSDDDYGYGQSLADIKASLEAAGATREWASQYQQRPRPAEGALFKIGQIEILQACPQLVSKARGWDLAATKNIGTRDPDFTAGIGMGRTPEGKYVIWDVRRERGGPDEVKALIRNTAILDGHDVRIGFPQDPGQAGKAQVLDYARLLPGYVLDSLPVTGDKATRAAPFASQVNVGNVGIVRADWNRPFLDELAAFPSGSHDDQVDGASEGFRLVGLGTRPVIIPPSQLTALRARNALRMRGMGAR
jgi:predicted phage terminase large subunit-like protein